MFACRLQASALYSFPSPALHRPRSFRPRTCMLKQPLGLCRRVMSTGQPGAAAAAAAGGRQAFTGSGPTDLAQWLSSSGISVSGYGQGSAKSLQQLWEEVEVGETQLFLEEGRPMREVAVLNVLINNSKGQTLYEAEQVLPNGNRRRRGLPLSEKMLPGERWQEAVVRGILEELGPVLPSNPQVEVDEGSMQETVETKESQSYPGLVSKYVCKRVNARVVSGLPETDFCTDEERSDGTLQHCWIWR